MCKHDNRKKLRYPGVRKANNEVIQRCVEDGLIPVSFGDTIFPGLIEGDSGNKRMNIGLHQILPDKHLPG